MLKFLNWLFNPEKAGQVSFLIFGFVMGMGFMSCYIYTMKDNGPLAQWLGVFGTFLATVAALYLGLRPVSRYYKIDLYQGSLNYQYNERVKTTISFAMYNSGNKPFVLYKAYLEGDKNEKLELEVDNSNFSYSPYKMPYLLGDNDVTFFYLSGADEKWSIDNHPENPYIVLQEVSGDKVKKRLKDFLIE